jgi:hypothetical protein
LRSGGKIVAPGFETFATISAKNDCFALQKTPSIFAGL